MKKNIFFIVIGFVIAGMIGVKAASLISSSQVIYKDNQTVDVALNNLYDELETGKEKIAESITNKGIDTTSDNTLEEMALNIQNITSGNPYLRYNEETGYVQAYNSSGDVWENIYATNALPLSISPGIHLSGKLNSTYYGGVATTQYVTSPSSIDEYFVQNGNEFYCQRSGTYTITMSYWRSGYGSDTNSANVYVNGSAVLSATNFSNVVVKTSTKTMYIEEGMPIKFHLYQGAWCDGNASFEITT